MAKLTREQVESIFNKTKSNYKGDNAFQGLQLISKYIDTSITDIIEWVGNETLCSVDVETAIKAGMTEEDFEKLAQLGWMTDCDSSDCALSCFI